MSLEFTPVIIIGAGRSGTNMLRDTLCKSPGFGTWDCDEINPIWRHGNTHLPNDHFDESHARAEVRRFIRSAFKKQWEASGKPDYLVEKTCANSLRVPFIEAIFPEAKFLYLVRNGADVSASASKRWRGEMELPSVPYYWSKIKYTPLLDLPLYLWRYIESRVDIILKRQQHLSYWGPQFEGLTEIKPGTPLLEICAHQWAACVDASDRSFNKIDQNRWMKLKYEELVHNPQAEFKKIHQFLGNQINGETLKSTLTEVSSKSVGKANKTLNTMPPSVTSILESPMRLHGYTTS